MASNRLSIKTKSKKYFVFIGENSFEQFRKVVSDSSSKFLFIFDKNVNKKCSNLVTKLLSDCKNHNKLVLVSSEKNKSLQTVNKILRYLSENKFDRESSLVSIGGGLIGDITGFTASVYQRGIKYYQIPTTILSAVDSSVGGKTGVNFNGIKNLVGTFYQPDGVFINTKFFDTLPKKEVISGIGELAKYAMIIPELYDFFLNEIKTIYFEKSVNEKVIINSLKIKSAIVNNDEKEVSGLRKVLNLGHTFGHGFESASYYKLKHGETVLCGLLCATLLSERLRMIECNYCKKILDDFSFIKINKLIKTIDTNSVISFMKSDKKNSSGVIRFVIPTQNELMIDYPVEEKIIYNVIEKFKSVISNYDI